MTTCKLFFHSRPFWKHLAASSVESRNNLSRCASRMRIKISRSMIIGPVTRSKRERLSHIHRSRLSWSIIKCALNEMALFRALPVGIGSTSKIISRSVPAVFYHANVNIIILRAYRQLPGFLTSNRVRLARVLQDDFSLLLLLRLHSHNSI